MVLAVSGLRGIQHAELEIPPGLSPVCGDTGSGEISPLKVMSLPGWGRSFLMGDSEYLIQPGQDHLRVIVRRRPFWTSRCLGFELSRGRRVCADPGSEDSHDPPVRVR
jgi:recombinational DNA repair ATPase RecF